MMNSSARQVQTQLQEFQEDAAPLNPKNPSVLSSMARCVCCHRDASWRKGSSLQALSTAEEAVTIFRELKVAPPSPPSPPPPLLPLSFSPSIPPLSALVVYCCVGDRSDPRTRNPELRESSRTGVGRPRQGPEGASEQRGTWVISVIRILTWS